MRRHAATLAWILLAACSEAQIGTGTVDVIGNASDAQNLADLDVNATGGATPDASGLDVSNVDQSSAAIDLLDIIDVSSTSLEAHWMQEAIGDCILAEEWLTLGAAPAFTHTLVDRNVCGPQGVTATDGTWSALPGGSIQLDWQEQTSKEQRRYTVAVLNATLPEIVAPGYPGYKAGKRWLNSEAFSKVPGTATFARTELRRSETPAAIWSEKLDVQVTISNPPWRTRAGCQLALAVTAEVQLGPPSKPETKTGSHTFNFPCALGKSPDGKWNRLMPQGWSQSPHSEWMKALEDANLWKTLPGQVRDIVYSRVWPVLDYEGDEPTTLFQSRTMAWWIEMLSPPPSSI